MSAALRSFGDSPKRLAHHLGLHESRVRAYADHQAERTPLWVLEALARRGVVEPIQHLAEVAGGVFLPLERRGEGLTHVSARALAEVADFAGGLMLDLADGKLTDEERRLRRVEVADALRSLATAYAALEPQT